MGGIAYAIWDTLHGTTPSERPSWPFASERVKYAYFVLAAIIISSAAS
jgi:hypothetical protein